MLRNYLPKLFIGLVLLALQLIVFNYINFMGYINPHIYLIAIILAPINLKRYTYLICSFVYGLLSDIVEDTGGIHAISCLILAYCRPILLKSIFGIRFDPKTFKFKNTTFVDMSIMTLIMVFTYEMISTHLEVFNLSLWHISLQRTLVCTLCSFLCISISLLLAKK